MITPLSITLLIIFSVVIYCHMKRVTQEEKSLVIPGAIVLALVVTFLVTPVINQGTIFYYNITDSSVISKISTRLIPVDDEGHYLIITDEDRDGNPEYTFSHLKLDGAEQYRYKTLLNNDKLEIVDDPHRPAEIERIVERMPDNLWTRFIGKDKLVIHELDLRVVVPSDGVVTKDKGVKIGD